MLQENQFPPEMVPLKKDSFYFGCHEGVSCFTNCCKKVEMTLYPYDVLRLKNFLQMHSEEFMQKYTDLIKGDNPYFPTVMLKLSDGEEKQCPFLQQTGCRVYVDRPSACRTYPLERAVARNPKTGRPEEFYFNTSHDYCHGHKEIDQFTVKEWVRNQRIDEYNILNDLWAELDTIFRDNPWKGEGARGPKQQMAFMVCYNIDGFKEYAAEQQLVKQFQLNKDQRRRIINEDVELMKFGFEWLKLILTGRSSLVLK